ncbi:MAG: DUF2238 domain-containing protein [Candidatus Moranbacteria bacterium]|nr:DUF2238 domain-containing protein [Candidatus Moranbacteria bacterium]
MIAKKTFLALLSLYGILFVGLAFNPVDRTTWLVENLTVWIIVGLLVSLYRKGIVFSSLGYVLMFVLIYLHTIGGHYTFALVPFDWFSDFFGFERNHYDRIAHFSVGFYAYAIIELMVRNKVTTSRLILYTYPVLTIATIAMSYELIEWVYAALANPEAGIAYLGSQGDIWDAQKDMLADTLGAIVAVIVYYFVQRNAEHSR